MQFLKKKPDYKLYLVTNSSRFDNFHPKVETVRIQNRSKLKKLYKEACALLTASYYESFNLPVLEALSQNCPVVGLKSAIIPELKAYVSLANNQKEFVEKMLEAADAKSKTIDQNKLRHEFSWEKYIKTLRALY